MLNWNKLPLKKMPSAKPSRKVKYQFITSAIMTVLIGAAPQLAFLAPIIEPLVDGAVNEGVNWLTAASPLLGTLIGGAAGYMVQEVDYDKVVNRNS